MDNCLRAYYPKLGGKKTLSIMREQFRSSLSLCALYRRADYLNLKSGVNHGYTHFKNKCGEKHPNYKPIGSERDYRGAMWVKVSDGCKKSGGYKNWKLKSHIVWEKQNGAVPDNCVIMFVDQDYHNCNIENLRCVPRKYLRLLANRWGNWYGKGPDILDAGIAWCDLYFALKEIKNKKERDK